ncbi:MAG: hypothetical protein QF645_02835 [Planctomycetota bacterium]|nr:hypothetical protein [Planctomycetota bacterium]
MRDLNIIRKKRDIFTRTLREEVSLWGKGALAIALLAVAFGIL